VFLWLWFRWWLCDLVNALVFDASGLGWDPIRGAFFHFRQTGLLAVHHLFESFTQILMK
jgi:hypothetical protein